MDIENFPTSPMAQKMLRTVTGRFYDRSYVGKWLYQVMGLELDAVLEKLDGMAGQAFLDTATWALAYWELMAGLPASPELPDDERRALVNTKLKNRHPDSPYWLSWFLSNLTGNEVTVEEVPGTYTFTVKIAGGWDVLDLSGMVKRLGEVKPAHLSYGMDVGSSASQDIYFGNVLVVRNAITIGCDVPDELT